MKHLNTLLNGVIPKRKEKHDLTINEQKIAQRLAPFLKTRIGKKNSVTNTEIRKIILVTCDAKLNGIRVRAMIQYIRRQKLCINLIASSLGYYIAENKQDVKRWLKSSKGRRKEIKLTENSFKI